MYPKYADRIRSTWIVRYIHESRLSSGLSGTKTVERYEEGVSVIEVRLTSVNITIDIM